VGEPTIIKKKSCSFPIIYNPYLIIINTKNYC